MRIGKKTLFGLLAAGMSLITANACIVQVRVACADDESLQGVRVWMQGPGDAFTDEFGIATFSVDTFGTYNLCVDTTTLPAGAKVSPACVKIKVLDDAPPVFNFVVTGPFCAPPAPGLCWMTGGGQIGKGGTGVGNFSFGGVVYPGCSPKAADGGNLNVIDHATGLHFQGQQIVVDNCSGVPTSSPKVNVNVIDFHGTGILSGIGGNPDATIPVSFVGRAVDNSDGGAGNDLLYIQVTDSSNAVVLQVGTSAASPAVISTGNIQIHTTGCNN